MQRCFQMPLQRGAEKKRQWSAFLGKGALTTAPEDLALVLNAIRGFLRPIVQAYEENQSFHRNGPQADPGRNKIVSWITR